MKHVLALLALLALAGCAAKSPIGPLGGIHIHADYAVFLDGKQMNFTRMEFMVREKYVHIEDMDGDVIHFHATGVTIGEFFRTLGMRFDNQCFAMDGKKYCANNQSTLKFFVNGRPNAEYGNYLPADLDKLLISYGPADENLTAQFAVLTNKSYIQSNKNMDLD